MHKVEIEGSKVKPPSPPYLEKENEDFPSGLSIIQLRSSASFIAAKTPSNSALREMAEGPPSPVQSHPIKFSIFRKYQY